jgi:protein involved in polysaccharide export with SLBB domain
VLVAGAVLAVLALCGCTAILSPVSGVPAHRLPPEFLAKPKNNMVPIDISRLRQDPPSAYRVDARDIVGIYVQGVLGEEATPPPFSVSGGDSDLPPSIGFPIPVRENGTISLPFVPPIKVRGLTVGQVEDAIRRAYTVDQRILQPGKDRIIVTMFKEREYRIIVMRRDGETKESQGQLIRLPAYQNDVLHALAKTGGFPGFEAKNEVKIMRGTLVDAETRDRFVKAFYTHQPCDPCLCLPPIPDDPSVVRIPLRLPPGETPKFKPTDIILQDGDIVLIEGREREVFYTGGMLGGGEHPLPRDYDLDVIGALSMVGQGIASQQGGGGGGGGGFGGLGGGFGRVPPGQLFIVRKTPCGDQVIIDVDLNRAIRDPRSRPLIQAEDTLVLQYRPVEDLVNFAIPTFFTFGVAELIRGGN